VLTSGGPPRAADGLAALRALVEQAAGRIAIMPGGVVRAADARRIALETGCLEIHSSAGMPPTGDAAKVRALRVALDAE
jgi:copper homeostasis protein